MNFHSDDIISYLHSLFSGIYDPFSKPLPKFDSISHQLINVFFNCYEFKTTNVKGAKKQLQQLVKQKNITVLYIFNSSKLFLKLHLKFSLPHCRPFIN